MTEGDTSPPNAACYQVAPFTWIFSSSEQHCKDGDFDPASSWAPWELTQPTAMHHKDLINIAMRLQKAAAG